MLRRLPTLWTPEDDQRVRALPSDEEAEAAYEGKTAQEIYDGVLEKVPDPDPKDRDGGPHRGAIPVHAYGRTGIEDMPLVSLGGFVPLAMHLFFGKTSYL